MTFNGIKTMVSFLMIIGITACAIAGLITVRLSIQSHLPFWVSVTTFVIVLLAFLSPFLLRDQQTPTVNSVYLTFLYIAYFLFVMVFLFFSLMLMRDFVWIILHAIFPDRIPSAFQTDALIKANLVLLIIVFCLSAYALFEGTRTPAVRQITLTTTKLTAPITVAVLPDIHIHRAVSKHKLQETIARTNALQPDIIALPGDIVDDRVDIIEDRLSLLSGLKARFGVFVTDGNHEIYIGPHIAHRKFIENNLIYLHNESKRLTPHLRIAGVPDIQGSHKGFSPNMEQALPETDASTYTILLAHSPKMFDMRGNTADLQVSGHTHGGQIFPFHILVKLANKYVSGLYHKGNRTLYVSRGAGQWGPQMRLLSPSEITFITIKPAKR